MEDFLTVNYFHLWSVNFHILVMELLVEEVEVQKQIRQVLAEG